MLDADWVYFQLEPSKMTELNRIIEGYEYLGVVTALDGKKGSGFVRTTRDTNPITREILSNLPFPVEVFDRNEAVRRTDKKIIKKFSEI